MLSTIVSTFGTCRAFREHPEPTAEDQRKAKYGHCKDCTNLVVFCTNSEDKPLTFRKPTPADYLGSWTRTQWLEPRNELNLAPYTYKHDPNFSCGTPGIVHWQQLLRAESRYSDHVIYGPSNWWTEEVMQPILRFILPPGTAVWIRPYWEWKMMQWQYENAISHWRLMRVVEPAAVWENY